MIVNSFVKESMNFNEELEELSDPGRYRPSDCPQCQTRHPLQAHGLYIRTLVDLEFEGTVRVHRFLCCRCHRTVSLLPQFASLPSFQCFLDLPVPVRSSPGRPLEAAAAIAPWPISARGSRVCLSSRLL